MMKGAALLSLVCVPLLPKPPPAAVGTLGVADGLAVGGRVDCGVAELEEDAVGDAEAVAVADGDGDGVGEALDEAEELGEAVPVAVTVEDGVGVAVGDVDVDGQAD